MPGGGPSISTPCSCAAAPIRSISSGPSGGSVNERAGRGRYRLAVFEVEGKLSFYDVECLVVLPMDVKRRTYLSGGQHLDEREPSASLLSGGLDGNEASKSPERLPVFGA